ncbi:MAG TPA: hypothetical protein VK912_19595 [Longimicrobiales bacterium]|nr:hypothetical protein [Longimicrobiales bacterium]
MSRTTARRVQSRCSRIVSGWSRHASWTCCAAILAVAGCNNFHISTSDMVISPNPAVPGDAVVATFVLNLVPQQSHTMIVVIDDMEHLRLTSSDDTRAPVTIQLGDAADLIAQYGAGEHAAYVRVIANASDEATRTQTVGFELREDVP